MPRAALHGCGAITCVRAMDHPMKLNQSEPLRSTLVTAALLAVCVAAPARGHQAGAPPPDPQATAAESQRLYQAGERALAGHQYSEAERAYEALRTLQPNTAEVHARLGLIYFQEGKFTEAVPALRRALSLKPTLANLDALLAMSQSELGQHEDARPALERVFRHSTDVVLKRKCGLYLQRAYTALGRDADAVAVALELTRGYPNDPEVLYHSGRLFANFAYLQTMKLAQVAPDSVWLHQAAGEANESQNLYDAAIKEYRAVLAQAPRRPGIHFRIGRALLSRARESREPGSTDADAAAEFEQELQIDPTNANAAYELGEVQRRARAFDRAIESFQLAIRADPDFAEALVGLGKALLAAGQPAAAVPHLQKAVALDARHEVAWYQLSRAFLALGNTAEQEKALAAFQRLHTERRAREDALMAPRSDVTQQELELQTPQ
jgi:tetratricopeptide (TPR) repeat protein